MGAATVLYEQIPALTASAATALVQAMTVDGWTVLRDRLAALLGRGDREVEQYLASELDRSCREIAAAPDTEQPAVRARAEALWREQLRSRLTEDKDLRFRTHQSEDRDLGDELQQLLAEAEAERGGSGRYNLHGSP